ncbi:FAD-dependent oxidoreductase [Bradyrhizobium sp. BRP22]|uniref:flavin monoamine oxidase family protein n=1 Tax=Bradyrhizobium sp. BRP22 TaxID=2793821 RepID=UPI001CD454FA|nr:FAD-dependent oxidoreductase [Bradyrhizobium sp. BRP22]MCA1458774.1 FAD-dependent oxidoreductase [Bradyrhizobium sp. BRP22]
MSQADYLNPTRRTVLKGAIGIAAGVHAISGASLAQSGKTPHVIIVGAGLAGLCAAYLLQQKGWSYTLLEAERNHIGGRVRTIPIGEGLCWEAGAMRIPTKHCIVRKYIRAFELELRPFVMGSSRTFLFARGKRATAEADIKMQFKLTPEEAQLSSLELWQGSVKGVAQGRKTQGFPDPLSQYELNELRTGNAFTTDKLIDLDRRSLRQLIQAARLPFEPVPTTPVRPLSDEAIEFTLFASGNLSIQHGAATEFLREENIGVWDEDFSEIKGGTSRLPEAFLSRLTTKPVMGCEVIRLEQDDARGRVTAVCRTASGLSREDADFLICTVPLPVLTRVEVAPPFSNDKQRAIIQAGYDSGTKVAVLTKNRFWEKKHGIFGGTSTTDLMTGAIVYPSDNAKDKDGTEPLDPAMSDRPGVLIASYSWGQEARRLGAMPASEREEFAIREVAKVHPELEYPGMVLHRMSWAWDTYRWCGGAFAFYQPGQFARIHQDLIRPEGRIYFAGEHCSHSHSWMEGALESAESVVDALDTAAGR